jgi:hypothetical protein
MSPFLSLANAKQANKGEIEGEKASIRQPKVMLMLAYEYKQA